MQDEVEIRDTGKACLSQAAEMTESNGEWLLNSRRFA